MVAMLFVLPFSALAVERDTPSFPENSEAASLDAPPTGDPVLSAPRRNPNPMGIARVHGGVRPFRQRGGEEHVASGVSNGARESFRNKANRRRDGLVSRYEQNQANKDPEDGSLADKAIHSQALTSKGDSTGKPAWMDNNPLKPATDSDSGPATNTLSAPEIVPGARTQPITSATGNNPSSNPGQ